MLVLALPYQSVATAVGRPREILLFNAIGAAVISAMSPPMIHFFGVMGLAASFLDRKSTRLNSSHVSISYAVFCLKKKKTDLLTFLVNSEWEFLALPMHLSDHLSVFGYLMHT